MRPIQKLGLSMGLVAALASGTGCADDVSPGGEDDALALTDDSRSAEAGEAGSVPALLDAATAPGSDGGDTVDASVPVASSSPDGPVTVPNPEGSYYASVIANGTGCPAGTWNTVIAPDRQTFRVVFRAYEVNINNQTPDETVTRNCTLNIKMHSPVGLSYSVKAAFYSGYAFLEPGVSASTWARYYFQGNPVPPRTANRTNLVGPYDSDFVFIDKVRTEDAVWSPCGLDRELIVNTTLQVKNSKPKRSGYANLGAEDGSTFIELALDWRACDVPAQRPHPMD